VSRSFKCVVAKSRIVSQVHAKRRTLCRECGRKLISPEGGSQPVWSRSGRELFYLDSEGRLTVVNVQSSSSFVASTPVRLLDRAYMFHSLVHPARTYDVSPDGCRFLMIKEADGPRLVVVLNWAATLKSGEKRFATRN
jgi:eukaryotic-like serine/threonine-protein kinase